MKLQPRSSARWRAAVESSSFCSPQLPPMAQAPKPISETETPVRPNVRVRMVGPPRGPAGVYRVPGAVAAPASRPSRTGEGRRHDRLACRPDVVAREHRPSRHVGRLHERVGSRRGPAVADDGVLAAGEPDRRPRLLGLPAAEAVHHQLAERLRLDRVGEEGRDVVGPVDGQVPHREPVGVAGEERRQVPLEQGELRVAGEAHVHVAAPGVGVRPPPNAQPHVVEGHVLDHAVRRSPQDHPVLALHPEAGERHVADPPRRLDAGRKEDRRDVDGLGLAPPVPGQEPRPEHDVREDQVLDRARPAHEDAEAAVRVVDHEVREDAVPDVAGVVVADPDRHRAGGDRAARHHHPLRAEERDAVVAGVDVAAEDAHVVALDEVDAVVVRDSLAARVAVDADRLDRDVLAPAVVARPGGGVRDGHPVDEDVPALEEADEVPGPLPVGDRPVLEEDALRHEARALPGEAAVEVPAVVLPRRVVERHRVAVDRAATRDRHPLRAPRRHDTGPLRLAARVAALDRVVLEPGGAEDRGAGLEVEGHERAQLDGLREVGAGGDADGAAARPVAGVDRALEGRGVERSPVARRPEVADVEGAACRWPAHPRRRRGSTARGRRRQGRRRAGSGGGCGCRSWSPRTLPPAGRPRQSTRRRIPVRGDLA